MATRKLDSGLEESAEEDKSSRREIVDLEPNIEETTNHCKSNARAAPGD